MRCLYGRKWELGGRVALNTGQPRLTVRLRESMLAAIDDLAAERGVSRTAVVRDLLAAGLRDRPTLEAEPPTEQELLAACSPKRPDAATSARRGAC